jgi:quercetin dioxygenase-like cupin family protein
VASCTTVDKETGTMTLLAFDSQGLSESTAPYDTLVYVFDGESEFKCEGKPVHLEIGDITLMPMNSPHAV